MSRAEKEAVDWLDIQTELRPWNDVIQSTIGYGEFSSERAAWAVSIVV
jgi:hypothetical protein